MGGLLMKQALFLLFVLVSSLTVSAQSINPTRWQEIDGSPSVSAPTIVKFTNGSLSCTGSVCTITVGGSGANAALSNLSGVAINTTLVSDTTLTDDLGSSSVYWRRAYAGQYFIDATLSAVAGNQTINKSAFRFIIGAGTSNAIITNSFVTASSLVICTPQRKDTTLLTVAAETASGSVTVIGNAGATADTAIACIVINQ